MSDKKVFANIINGEERPAASGDVLDIIDPSTGEVYATSPNSGQEDVDAACQAAAAAFETYRWTTPAERQRFLLRLADVIEANAEELARIECENTGKPFGSVRPTRSCQWSTKSASSLVRRGCWKASRRAST
jgi:betaine-aldehyde dehydrogenase